MAQNKRTNSTAANDASSKRVKSEVAPVPQSLPENDAINHDIAYPGLMTESSIEENGLRRWSNGTTYYGGWVEGKAHGRGKVTFPDGRSYNGEWLRGFYHGHGTMTYSNGTGYFGFWDYGRQHGLGTRISANGDLYHGEFRADKLEGMGTLTNEKVGIYRGQWRNSKKEGRGVLTCFAGFSYDGEWKEDKWHGQGKLTSTLVDKPLSLAKSFAPPVLTIPSIDPVNIEVNVPAVANSGPFTTVKPTPPAATNGGPFASLAKAKAVTLPAGSPLKGEPSPLKVAADSDKNPFGSLSTSNSASPLPRFTPTSALDCFFSTPTSTFGVLSTPAFGSGTSTSTPAFGSGTSTSTSAFGNSANTNTTSNTNTPTPEKKPNFFGLREPSPQTITEISGRFRDNNYDGRMTITYTNGDVEICHWNNGVPTGWSRKTLANGTRRYAITIKGAPWGDFIEVDVNGRKTLHRAPTDGMSLSSPVLDDERVEQFITMVNMALEL